MKSVRVICAALICLVALLSLGGCGTGKAAAAPTPANSVPTVTLAASSILILPNGSTTLNWSSTAATSVSIDNGVGAVAGSGSITVKPAQTTTYTITATGAGGSANATVTVTVSASAPPPPAAPTVTITSSLAAVPSGGGSTILTVTATNATSVVISDNLDTTTFPFSGNAGSVSVPLTKTTIFTATATGLGGTATATVTVRIAGTVGAVNHVLFMLQENRSFDTYFGMLNPYRKAQSSPGVSGAPQPWNIGDDGNPYNVDGIDDKLATTNPTDSGAPQPTYKLFHTTTTCLDDMTSAWFESYGDVHTYAPFGLNRSMQMQGFVHTATGFATSGSGSGAFTDLFGKRAMAYYTDTSVSGVPELNYYYYMASQFALSDRWFSPVASKSTPNRIATLTGGTTQGLVRDPFVDDKLSTLAIQTIFEELDKATPAVSWKIYYGLTNKNSSLPVTTFSDFAYAGKYIIPKTAPCVLPFVPTASNNFCVDSSHIAPMSQLFTDMTNGTLPAFSYIEADYGANDEHPGSGQSILLGQAQIATIVNTFMNSANSPTGAWHDSVFFVSYDEGGGPYDHVPPVPGHSNDNNSASALPPLAIYPDIGGVNGVGGIAVNPETPPLYFPCLENGPADLSGNPTPTAHCDLKSGEPGTNTADAPAILGFAAQLGFRVPNMVISPFSRKHYVSHVPMDHTAVIKFVESRFINPTAALTNRDAAQPSLLDFFDFTMVPWSTPPPAANLPVPAPVGGTCNPGTLQ